MCSSLPPEKKKRERRHASRYRYCRRVKGDRGRYQARFWLQGLGSINLGLYPSEWLVGRTVKAFIHRFTPGVDLCDVLESLRRDGLMPKHVLAKYVCRVPGESTFIAKVKKHGQQIQLGPFVTEGEAHRAMVKHLAKLPRPRRPVAKSGKRSPYIGIGPARTQLGISEERFTKWWLGVFTSPLECRRVLLKDEVEVAMQAGGGAAPTAAKRAVAEFRLGLGRLDRHPVGRELDRCKAA